MSELPRRFYCLDILRGLAAFAVVIFHWSYLHNVTQPGVADPQKLPLYAVLHPIYEDGWRAVHLFFCLSGFIFFWLYPRRLATREVGLREFALLRFSRLYPLHLATLLAVLVGQLAMRAWTGSFFVFEHNDAYHFVLQLLLASHWGLQRGLSFNGPNWSVSVEVLLYALFALLCAARRTRWWHLAALAAVGYALAKTKLYGGEHSLGMAIVSFFGGGLAFKAFLRARAKGLGRGPLGGVVLALGVALLWVLVPLVHNNGLLYSFVKYLEGGRLAVAGRDVVGFAALEATGLLHEAVLFPLTLVAVALADCRDQSLPRRFSVLGDVSYSSYMIHFPLLMVFYAVAMACFGTNAVFSSPLALALFFAVLFPLSVLVYRRFERPAQLALRKRLLGEPRAAASPGHAAAGAALNTEAGRGAG